MNDIIRDNMRIILSQEWNGKPTWEYIRDGILTAAPEFKGRLYDQAKIQIMYVGHAVNGWEELKPEACTSLEATLDAILSQPNGLDTFVNQAGCRYSVNGHEKVYRHITSKFLRLIKQILELQGESDNSSDDSGYISEESWYHDSKNWNQKIIWSNLYCVAPRKTGNPEDAFLKPCMTQYRDIIRAQINEYHPDIVIFCPLTGYFQPWKRIDSCLDLVDLNKSFFVETKDVIIGKGTIAGTPVILSRRPDARGASYADVYKKAKDISKYITDTCKKKDEG